MQRRGFIKLSTFASAGITLPGRWSGSLPTFSSTDEGNKNDDLLIDPIVPIRFYTNRKEKMLQQLIELKNNYRLRRFLLCAPMDETRLTGFPKQSVYKEIGEMILEVKDALRSQDIEIGWWCAPSIRSGYDRRFQNITDLSGRIAAYSPCPLDPVFREEFSSNVALVAKIAKPFIIQFEDDFELSHQPPNNINFGCFCPAHLAEFSKRQGRIYKREELLKLFEVSDGESVALRRKWADLSRDTLTDFAKLIREKVDKVAPKTRISLCQAGVSDFDGDFTESVVRAFAGNTRPLTRLYGSSYSSDDPVSLPASIFHALYSRQHLPDDVECIHESDTYPHTRFFMSAAKIRSFMTVAFAYGFDDSLFYSTQYLDNLLEERGYLEMYKREAKRFSALKAAVANAPVVGCEVMHHPFAHTAVPYVLTTAKGGGRPSAPLNSWISVLGMFGIPYTSGGGRVKMVSGASLKIMSDGEIHQMLRGAVMLDGYAAYLLSQRGFGKLIGAEVSPGKEADFSFEGIRNIHDHEGLKGELMYNLIFAPAGSEGGNFYVLNPHENAEVITDFLAPGEKPVIPGFLRFENEQGGRVVITAFDLRGNRSSAVFNYKKKELIREAVEWVGREELPVFVRDLPNIFCICNKSKAGNYLIVTVINLSSDLITDLSIDVAAGWKNAMVSQLESDGRWLPVSVQRRDNTLSMKIELMLMGPVVLKLNK
ncbi:MAG: hypothetical protein M9933_11880 [Chitinophagaceae bacterium]|nr:hypothetical protein [Chitinophagaceae bacterium]